MTVPGRWGRRPAYRSKVVHNVVDQVSPGCRAAAAPSCIVFMWVNSYANEFSSHFTNGVPPSIDSNQSASERQSAAIKRRSWGLSTYSQSFLSCTSVLPGTPCPKGWREISKKPCTDSEDQGRAWNHLAAPRQGIAPCRILNSGCCQSVGKIIRP